MENYAHTKSTAGEGIRAASENLAYTENSGGMKEMARSKKYSKPPYGIGSNRLFLPYNETKSDANTMATFWAYREDVNNGDWRLAPYNERWYIIEKFESLPHKYQVMEYVPEGKYEYYVERWEREYGRSHEEELARYYDALDNSHRQAVKDGEGRSDFNDDVPEHTGQSKSVHGLGAEENEGKQDQLNAGESGVSSDTDRAGDGTSRLEQSRDDEIRDADYLSAVERGDNVIPLFERFNTEKKDIRYSRRDFDGALSGIEWNEFSRAVILSGLRSKISRQRNSRRI